MDLRQTLQPSYLLEDNLTDRGDHTCPLLGQGPTATTLGYMGRTSCSHGLLFTSLISFPLQEGGGGRGERAEHLTIFSTFLKKQPMLSSPETHCPSVSLGRCVL